MWSEALWMFLLQVGVVGGIATGVVMYLLRSLMFKKRVDPAQEDLCVLVTGCDSGIGHALARHLDGLGVKVFAGCLQPHGEGALALAAEASPKLKVVELDVTKQESVDNALQYIKQNLPSGQKGLWAVINNAGLCVCGEFEWMTWDQIERQVQVNFLGALRVTRAALPLVKTTKGRVLLLSSVGGLRGYPGLSVYCATKHAMEGLADSLRHEMLKHNVRVVSVQPGDFSKYTCILHQHHKNMNDMWDQMTDEQREQNKEYFQAYHTTAARVGVPPRNNRPPQSPLCQPLAQGLEEALFATKPANRYLLAPHFRTRAKLFLLGIVPEKLADRIIGWDYKNRMNGSAQQV